MNKIFNSKNNINGNIIKVIIGSKVIQEGLSMENVGSLHIFD